MDEQTIIQWLDNGRLRKGRWRSEAGLPPPASLAVVEDNLPADAAWRALSAGEALLWQGDWPGARRLMQALTQRADAHFKPPAKGAAVTPAQAFAAHRQRQGERAAVLARLLVPLGPDYKLP